MVRCGKRQDVVVNEVFDFILNWPEACTLLIYQLINVWWSIKYKLQRKPATQHSVFNQLVFFIYSQSKQNNEGENVN